MSRSSNSVFRSSLTCPVRDDDVACAARLCCTLCIKALVECSSSTITALTQRRSFQTYPPDVFSHLALLITWTNHVFICFGGLEQEFLPSRYHPSYQPVRFRRLSLQQFFHPVVAGKPSWCSSSGISSTSSWSVWLLRVNHSQMSLPTSPLPRQFNTLQRSSPSTLEADLEVRAGVVVHYGMRNNAYAFKFPFPSCEIVGHANYRDVYTAGFKRLDSP